MTPVVPAFLSVILVSAVSLIGVATLTASEALVRRLASIFVSFAAGALLGDAFIHLVPEIFERSGAEGTLRSSLLILSGMVLFFVVEKLLRRGHGLLHGHHRHDESSGKPELAIMNIAGDAIHNYIDGLLIGASWLAGPELGIATTLAVILHEIPQELGDFGILVHSGLSTRQALLVNATSAAVAILGTATALFASTVAHETVTTVLLPVTAGGFVYIAAADLIPELQHDRSVRSIFSQTALMSGGILVMALLTLVG